VSASVTLPPDVLVGFTGGTGGLTDLHAVANVSISASAPLPTQAGSEAVEAGIDASSGGNDGGIDATVDATSPDAGTTFDAENEGEAASPDAGGPTVTWQENGKATATATGFQLTDTNYFESGSAFSTSPVSSSTLTVTFDSTIGGGSGADGMTLVLADPSYVGPTALGQPGSGLGFLGIQGVAVTFDTYPSDSVGIVNDLTAVDSLHFVTSTTMVTALRATNHVVVTVDSGQISLSIDGTTVLSANVSLPPNVLVGFTGSSGGLTDRHAVDNISIVTSP
jgi:hypothetical protein